MTSSNDLMHRIDSLMQRKRVFVAGVTQTTSIISPAPHEDEDIPVLTDIVDINEVSSDTPHLAVHSSFDPQIEVLTHELSQRLQQRFAAELPALIDAATTKLAQELQQTVNKITEDTLRDVAAQRQLRP